jgi:hypothetical protein
MPPKKTLEDYQKLAKSKGWKYLKNGIPKSTSVAVNEGWSCTKSHIITVAYAFVRNTLIKDTIGCFRCTNKSINDYLELAKSKEGWEFLLKKIPATTHTIAIEGWMCSNSHILSQSYKQINKFRGNKDGCMQCWKDRSKIRLEDYISLASSKGWIYLLKTIPKGVAYPAIEGWECPFGHILTMTFARLNSCRDTEHGCSVCNDDNRRVTIKDYHNVAKKKRWTFLP